MVRLLVYSINYILEFNMKLKKYLLCFTTNKGNTITRVLYSDFDVYEWCKILDKRINNGTCIGYTITSI